MHFMCFSTTVPVYVNHVHPVQSTFFYFMWQWFLQYIYSQHAASTVIYAHSTYMHFMCLSTTVPVYVTHLHPVQSTSFYFMRQWFLQYIYSQHAASTVIYAYSTYTSFMCLSTTVPVYVNHFHPVQSTFFYFMRQWFLRYIYIQHAVSFSVPSLTFIRWKRMHGYTSLIRPRLHSTSTATFREHFHPSPTATFRLHFRDNYNRKDDLVHLNLPSFFQQTDTLSGLFHPGQFVNIFVTTTT
jgi:hypothetical protein